MAKLGIGVLKGVHLGIHAFRHGVTTELLEAETPIQVVTRMMRHGDSKVTLDHYAHIISGAEQRASSIYQTRSELNWSQTLNWSQDQ